MMMKRLLITLILLFVLSVGAGSLFYLFTPRNEPSMEISVNLRGQFLGASEEVRPVAMAVEAQTDETVQAVQTDRIAEETMEEPVAEDASPVAMQPDPPAEEPAPVVARPLIQDHTLVAGDTLSGLSGSFWGDMFLWPDMYVLNDMLRSGDPDLIFIGERIRIYQSLYADGVLTAEELEILMDAYLTVYDIYKGIGSSKDLSVWFLLYSALKYDPNFLTKNTGRLEARDVEMAMRYYNERGVLD